MANVFPESVAFAALSLSQELCITMLRKGLLTHGDVDEIFAKAVEAQSSIASPINDGAAALLKDLQQAIEWEWPRGAPGA
ncbi:hypothetical protein [Hyphomicrobium zavarzinii]|uniref:hypothetical protein n=1 Tax=Hyphomicrobium zavarzinii TaxID=48292 RepID=UPI00037132A8|nr:hypothetical protein [Hyphomicrobium zavarzinii]